MAQTYFAILTAIGEAKLANATALGTTLQLTKMAVGDGNGATPIPSRTQTALVHENRRAPLNTLFVDPANASQIVAEQIIPEDVGGWWIRELGLYDAAGDLCAVANCPDTYKPVLASGSGRTQIIRMVLIVTNTSAVELKIDPSVVLAPRGYVDQMMSDHEAKADPHPQYVTKDAQGNVGIGVTPKTWDAMFPVLQVNAKTVLTADLNSTYCGTNWYRSAGVYKRLGAGFALQYHQDAAAGKHIWKTAPTGAAESTVAAWTAAMTLDAATGVLDVPAGITTATPPAGDNSLKVPNTAFVQAAIAALVASSPAALDTLNELAAALGNDANFAATMNAALAGKVGKDAQGNVGIGVTPKAWGALFPVIQVNEKTAIAADINSTYYGTNWYHKDGVYKRLGGGFALQYHQDASAGKHIWKVGANGATDSSVNFTNAMTLDANTGVLTVTSGVQGGSSTTEATAGLARVATQVEVNAGADDATLVTPKKLRGGFSISLTSNGYIAFPWWLGGLILQWASGAQTTVGDQDQTIAFPVTFPNACLHLMVSTRATTNNLSDAWFQERSFTSSNCVVVSQWNGNGTLSGGMTPRIFAIGY